MVMQCVIQPKSDRLNTHYFFFGNGKIGNAFQHIVK